MSSAYLRLLIFLPAILIPAYASSSSAFCMMYSAYKLNKQGDNIQPWRTPFLIWDQNVVPCPVLTIASWTAYRFLRRQVKWSGIPISLRIRPSSLSVSLSHQETSISLLSFPIRRQPEWNHSHRKLTNLMTWTAALSNSMKQWAWPWRATVMVESLDKIWSTGEGNGKPLQ